MHSVIGKLEVVLKWLMQLNLVNALRFCIRVLLLPTLLHGRKNYGVECEVKIQGAICSDW